MTTDEPLPDRCGAECRDGGYCENYPKGDGDRCRMHGGDSPSGDDHGQYDHGAFSEHFRSDLTDAEREALDALVAHLESIDDERTLAAEIAAEALLKYKRSADSRFLREARQWFGDFNLLPNEDEINVGGDGMNPITAIVARDTTVDNGDK